MYSTRFSFTHYISIMNLQEFQAKALLAQYNLPVPKGEVVESVEEALQAVEKLSGYGWMVKAQIHAGGRGKAGGVRYAKNAGAVEEIVQSLLGKRLVTYQTDAQGQPVNKILISVPCNIAQELYLSVVIDRASNYVVILASSEGGVEIEKDAEEKIIRLEIPPIVGLMDNAMACYATELRTALDLPNNLDKDFAHILSGLYKLFMEKDLSLIEINPLAIDKEGKLICLDAKVTVDDNALYRQSEIRDMRDISQEDPRESHARDWELNYIPLEGSIGCMVNGAGLAMATMDLIKHHGGNPANFLDVGGGATKERVIEAFKIILADKNVKGVLINIFGGIVRCDMIAEGIIGAMSAADVKVPVMVRLVGNNADTGIKLLKESGLNLMASNDLTAAVQQIIEATK